MRGRNNRMSSLSLASRGDLKGFTATLALSRDAERKNNEVDHARHITNLYRMLPTIIQTTIFRDHYVQLTSFIQCVRRKLQNSIDCMEVNWNLIEEQIKKGVIIPPWSQLTNLNDMHVPKTAIECAQVLLL